MTETIEGFIQRGRWAGGQRSPALISWLYAPKKPLRPDTAPPRSPYRGTAQAA
jgi:hypothetical protein